MDKMPWEDDPIVETMPWDDDESVDTAEQEILNNRPPSRLAPGYTDLQTLGELGTGALKGIANVGSEVIKTASAANDAVNSKLNEVSGGWLGQSVGPEGSSTSQMLERNIPRLEAEPGTAEEIAVPATELAGAVYGGVKTGVKVASKIAGEAPGLIRKGIAGLGGLMAGEAASTVPMDKNTTPLVTGEDSSLGEATGYSIPAVSGGEDATDDPATARTKKAVDLAQDAITSGIVAGSIGKGASLLGSYGLNVFKKATVNYRNLDTVQKEFVETILKRATNIPDGASADEVSAAYQDIIDYTNKHAEVLTSFGPNTIDDIVENQDTISVLLSKLDPNNPKDMLVKQELEALRASALAGNASPKLKTAMEAPETHLKGALGEIEEVKGGDKAIQQTQDTLIEEGSKDMTAARIPEEIKKVDVADVEKQTEDFMRNDPQLGPAIQKAEDAKVSLSPNDPAREAQSKVTHAIKDADLAAEGRTKDAYKKVADSGAPADAELWKNARETNRKGISPTNNSLLDELDAQSDGSFGHLYTKVRPELSKMLDGATGIEKDRLLQLKRSIDGEQFDRLKSNADEFGYSTQTGRDATTAKETHIEEQITWNDGLAKDMRDNRIDHPPFDPKHPTRPSQPLKFETQGNKTLMAAIKDPDRAKEVTALRSAVGIKNSPLFDDVVVAEVAKDTLTSMTNKGGKLADVDTTKMLENLQKMSAGLSGKNKARLETMFTNVRDGKLKGDALKAELEDLVKLGDVSEAKILDDYLGDFITKNSDGKMSPKPNASAVLDGLFTGKQSGTKLDNIISKASADPVAKKGLEAAWAKHAQSLLKNQKDVPEFPEHFIKYGKQIYGDDNPFVVDALVGLNKRAREISNANKVRMGGGLPYSKNQTEAVGAVNQITTWIFGVLNPTAARIRTVSSDLMKQNNSGDIARQAGDIILGNAKDFARIAQEIQSKKAKALSPEHKKMMFKWMVKMGIYGDGDEDMILIPAKSQTEEAFKIDKSRPILENDDGSFSTERTATRQDEKGKWVVFPTIVGGKELSEDEAWEALKSGKNKSVGSFDSLEESETYASSRSEEIGKVREKDRKK